MSASPGIVAAADQVLAAMRFAEEAWPHNAHLLNDDRADAAVRRALAEPYQTLGLSYAAVDRVTADPAARVSGDDFQLGASHLLMAGEVFKLLPGVDLKLSIDYLASTRPRGLFGSCARCELFEDRYGHLLIATPPNVVALGICGTCAEELNRDLSSLVWI